MPDFVVRRRARPAPGGGTGPRVIVQQTAYATRARAEAAALARHEDVVVAGDPPTPDEVWAVYEAQSQHSRHEVQTSQARLIQSRRVRRLRR